MSISPLSNQAYASLLSGLSGSTNSATESTTSSSGSLGDQLLAELTQSQSSNSNSSDPLLQELVSLSPAATGQATTTPQTYSARGLLQEIQSIQSGMMLNDPLLQTDATGTSDTNSSSLLQSLLASSQTSTSGSNTSTTSSTDALSQTLATTSTTDPATLAALFKKDPSLVNVYVQSQMNQGVLSMLGE